MVCMVMTLYDSILSVTESSIGHNKSCSDTVQHNYNIPDKNWI